MTESKRHLLASTVIAITVAELLILGLQSLSAPRLLQLTYRAHPLWPYQGPTLVLLATLLAWCHEWVSKKLVWMFVELYRWISTAIMLGVLGAEALMHMFSVPHLEGWWVPVLGGGAIVTAVTAWFQKLNPRGSSVPKRPTDDKQLHP